MTQPVQEPSQGRTDQAQEFRTRQLFRRPPLSPPSQSASAVGYPVSHRLDGLLWAPWTDQSEGHGAFASPAADLTAPYGYSISSVGASQVDAEKGIYVGLGPLGPRTGWGVDLILKTGPSSGRVIVEFATTPVDEAQASIDLGFTPPGIGSDVSIADPYFMENGGVTDEFSGWWKAQASFGGIDLYTSGTPGWDYYPWYTFDANMFWVAGTDGTMLTADGVNPGPYDAGIENAFETGGGDMAWWMRIRANGKNASSGGYGFEMAGFHMYRVNGDATSVAF